MATSDTYWAIDQLFGERVWLASHPLGVALLVMERFGSLAEAVARPSWQQFGNALSDSFIVGSGDVVHCALRVLTMAGAGSEEELEKAEGHAGDCWRLTERYGLQAPTEEEDGLAAVKALFRRQFKRWSQGELPEGRFRETVEEKRCRASLLRHVAHLPRWQGDFIRESFATRNAEVSLASCGGGWFAVHVRGEEGALKRRVQRRQVEEETREMVLSRRESPTVRSETMA